MALKSLSLEKNRNNGDQNRNNGVLEILMVLLCFCNRSQRELSHVDLNHVPT